VGGGVSSSNGHSIDKPLKINLLIIAFLIILPALCYSLFGCAGGTLNEYKPESPEHEAIKATLVAFENAWNKHDELHDDFIIWEKGRRSILYSKSKFVFNLRDIMREYRHFSLGKPAMWLKRHKATVLVPMQSYGRPSTSIFSLIKEENKWLFLEWEF
jgi:hypothetical protein